MTNYAELRAALESATPGPWHIEQEKHGTAKYWLRGNGMFLAAIGNGSDNYDSQRRAQANARLIAACHPEAIRALLAERDELFFALQEISHPEGVRGDATKIARAAIEAGRQTRGEPVKRDEEYKPEYKYCEDGKVVWTNAADAPVVKSAEPMEADTEDLIERLLDAQQDINLAANEHMSQIFCDASALIDEIVQVLCRLSTRPQQIQEGWQLVPKEPTEAMKNASLKACDGKAYPADMRIGPMAMNADVYKAMLAAAPDPVARESEPTDGMRWPSDFDGAHDVCK